MSSGCEHGTCYKPWAGPRSIPRAAEIGGILCGPMTNVSPFCADYVVMNSNLALYCDISCFFSNGRFFPQMEGKKWMSGFAYASTNFFGLVINDRINLSMARFRMFDFPYDSKM